MLKNEYYVGFMVHAHMEAGTHKKTQFLFDNAIEEAN